MAKESPRKNEATWVESRQRWQIKVQKDGERKTFTSSITGKKGKFDAERKADKWLTEGESKDVRVQAAWKEFLADVKLLTSTDNYLKHEQIGRTWILPNIKNKRVSSITLQDWQNCINAAYKKGRSKKTLKNIRASATVFYRFCFKNRYPLERPEGLTIPKDAKVGKRNILQPNQLKVLFTEDTIQKDKKPQHCFYIHYWRALVLTGLRPGELAGLRKGEDIQGPRLTVRRSINNHNEITGGKNENAPRSQVLTTQLTQVLREQEQMLKQLGIISPWIFPGEDGDQMQTTIAYDRWRTFCRQRGMRCSLYELRHTMVSMTKTAVPEATLKKLLGHTQSMDTYGVYDHEIDGELAEAARLMDEVFSRHIGAVGTGVGTEDVASPPIPAPVGQ